MPRPRTDLSPEQRQTIDAILAHPGDGCATVADLGMGKTVIMLTVLSELLPIDGGPVLVIAPLIVANRGWPAEIAAWAHTAGLTYSVLTGSAKQRQRAYETPADLHIINQENVTWLFGLFVEKRKGKWVLRKRWPYRIVVIDELTAFGDHDSQRFNALKLIRPHIKLLYGMTATPAAEGYLKFLAMVYLLDRGNRLGAHITHFRDRYFTQNPYSRKWSLRPGADVEIMERVADLFIPLRRVRGPDDHPRLITRPVVLSDAEMAEYRRFERDFILETPDGTVIEAVHAAALRTKLQQLAAGAVYDADRKVHFFHNRKTEALAELVEEAGAENLIVAYWFKSSLARIKKALPKAVELNAYDDTVDRWNRGEIRTLLLHPQAAGRGVNLQHGGSVIVLYDMPSSNELYQQLIGRVDRTGQTKPVRIYHLSAEGTVDPAIEAALQGKQEIGEAFMNEITRRRKTHVV